MHVCIERCDHTNIYSYFIQSLSKIRYERAPTPDDTKSAIGQHHARSWIRKRGG